MSLIARIVALAERIAAEINTLRSEAQARTPKITVSDVEPANPAEGDVWIDTMGT